MPVHVHQFSVFYACSAPEAGRRGAGAMPKLFAVLDGRAQDDERPDDFPGVNT